MKSRRKTRNNTPKNTHARKRQVTTQGEASTFELVSVTKTYRVGDRVITPFRDATVNTGARAVIGLVGASGAGKTTALSLLAGIEQPTRGGEVRLLGKPVPRREGRAMDAHRRSIGFVTQAADLRQSMDLVGNVIWPLLLRGIRESAVRGLAQAFLEELGISDGRRRPRYLSGGERQRVAIARALLLCEPGGVILVDEPTSALDDSNAKDVCAALRRAADLFDRRVVIVTHDPRVLPICDAVYRCEGGQIREAGLPALAATTPVAAGRTSGGNHTRRLHDPFPFASSCRGDGASQPLQGRG